MTKDVQPFFPVAATPTRSLGAALPPIGTPAVTSPWSPRMVAPIAEEPSADQVAELAALRDEARAQGRAEGMAETAALRERLTGALARLAMPADEVVAPAAELIAEVATCVIETWLGHADRSALFAPLVRSWLERSPAVPAAARVHPDDAAALTQAIGDAPLAVVPDPRLARGALEIRGATLELSHDWRTRLDELRIAIAAALGDGEPTAAAPTGGEPTGAEP
jgi:flagellar biosynthesis/type III secretory pathway protein FliH